MKPQKTDKQVRGFTMLHRRIDELPASQMTSGDATFLILESIDDKLDEVRELLRQLVQINKGTDSITASAPEDTRKWYTKIFQ